jgi:hypothetical protein
MRTRTSGGTETEMAETKSRYAQFNAAKNNGEGMALKIRTRTEDMPDGRDSHF